MGHSRGRDVRQRCYQVAGSPNAARYPGNSRLRDGGLRRSRRVGERRELRLASKAHHSQESELREILSFVVSRVADLSDRFSNLHCSFDNLSSACAVKTFFFFLLQQGKGGGGVVICAGCSAHPGCSDSRLYRSFAAAFYYYFRLWELPLWTRLL